MPCLGLFAVAHDNLSVSWKLHQLVEATAAMEDEIATAALTTNDGELDDDHPWPYLNTMFSYVDVKDSSYRMKCLLCLPKNVEILSYKNSPSNLKKHIEVSSTLMFFSHFNHD